MAKGIGGRFPRREPTALITFDIAPYKANREPLDATGARVLKLDTHKTGRKTEGDSAITPLYWDGGIDKPPARDQVRNRRRVVSTSGGHFSREISESNSPGNVATARSGTVRSVNEIVLFYRPSRPDMGLPGRVAGCPSVLRSGHRPATGGSAGARSCRATLLELLLRAKQLFLLLRGGQSNPDRAP